MIEVSNLRKSFPSRAGRVAAVAGVSFTARDGEITGLLGPNGSGKTTTVRIVCTLLAPDAGTARVDGIDASVDPLAVRRRVGVLPDARGLSRRLSARENIVYFARLQGLDAARAAERAEHLVRTLGMGAFADRWAEGYSQGQRTRTALARALVADPPNVLLDEPTNGLDIASARAVRAALHSLREQGRCVLLSSHLMHEVAELCDRVVVIAGGRTVATGSLDEVRAQAGADTLEAAYLALTGRAQEPGS